VVVIEVAVGVVTVGTAFTAATVTFVQAEQLLASLLSVTDPLIDISLSAQSLTEYVPAETNVYVEDVAVLLAPAPRAAILLAEMAVNIGVPPLAELDNWKKLLNVALVLLVVPVPMFEINPEKVSPVPTVAVIGDVIPAVRSEIGQVAGAVPATAPEYAEFPAAFSARTV
jgi:hypothetical protein